MSESPFPYGEQPGNDFEAQYRRVFEASECKNLIELAKVLEISQSSISDARRRQIVPLAWLVTLRAKKRANPDWIRTGQGPRLAGPPEGAEAAEQSEPLRQASTEELLAELLRRGLERLA